MPETTLIVDNLSVSLAKKSILEKVSLRVERGQIVAVLGASGCGKTTLLRAIAGFVVASRGTVSILGKIVNRDPPEHRPVSMLFQDPALLPDLSVDENALLARRNDRASQLTRVGQLARRFHLDDKRSAKIRTLSGGEKQRAALIRALVNARDVMLLDEPVKSAFNLDLRWEVMAAVKDYLQREGITTLLVTHDFEEAAYLASQVTVVVNGRASMLQAPGDIYLAPPTQQVARLLGSVNEVPAECFLDPTRREAKCPVRVVGGDLRHIDGARVVLFRPSSLRVLRPGTAFDVDEVASLGEYCRVRFHPSGKTSPITLEATVRPEEDFRVGECVNLEIARSAISVFDALGERLSVRE